VPAGFGEKLAQAEQEGCLPKVVVPVHFSGQPCDMRAIHTLAERYGFKIIEDASHAIGAKYLGERVGNGCYSDIAVFSFHPVKIITTGEGGMALTKNPDLAARMELLRSHGVTRDPELMTREADGPWYYEQIGLGFNYRMTDIQAALGLSQMTRLDGFVARRYHLADRYDDGLRDLPLTLPWRDANAWSAFHLYVIRLELNRIEKSRREIFETLRERSILVNLHYIPVHTQPYYRAMGFKRGDFPEAEVYYREAITLPLYANLSESDQDRVITALREIL